MVQLSFKPRRGQQSLLAACTTSRPPLATATHLSRRADRDRVIGFGDVAAMPDPEWATAERPGRFTVAGLVPGGQLATVPLHNPAEDPQPIEALIDDVKTVMHNRDIAFVDDLAEDRKLSDARCTLHVAAAWVDEAAGFALAEDAQAIGDAVAARPELRHDHALLMALAPVVAMLKELDVPEASDAERWAAQHRMSDSVDILGVGDVVITYDPEHPYIGVQGRVTAADSNGVTVEFTSHDIRTLSAAELVLAVRAVANLKEPEPKPEPLADWELELLALPEGNPDPGAERAFADMDATADAVDAWYAEQAKNDSHDARGAIFADLLFDENEA